MKFAFLILSKFGSERDCASIQNGTARIIGVSSIEEAGEVAQKLLEEGIGCIELCGAFGKKGAAEIIRATGNRIPVGYITYLPEQDEVYRAAFSNKKSVYCQNRKKKKVMEGPSILLENIDKIHTTKLGIDRIRRNLKIETEDVVEYCKNKILMENCNIYKRGKNWYCEIDDLKITINSSGYTIITAHMIKSGKQGLPCTMEQ